MKLFPKLLLLTNYKYTSISSPLLTPFRNYKANNLLILIIINLHLAPIVICTIRTNNKKYANASFNSS